MGHIIIIIIAVVAYFNLIDKINSSSESVWQAHYDTIPSVDDPCNYYQNHNYVTPVSAAARLDAARNRNPDLYNDLGN